MNTTATSSKYLRSITQSDSSTFDPKLVRPEITSNGSMMFTPDELAAVNTNGNLTFDPKSLKFGYKSEWKVNITPNYIINMNSAPNAFHRLMQRLFLGIKWAKNEN